MKNWGKRKTRRGFRISGKGKEKGTKSGLYQKNIPVRVWRTGKMQRTANRRNAELKTKPEKISEEVILGWRTGLVVAFFLQRGGRGRGLW